MTIHCQNYTKSTDTTRNIDSKLYRCNTQSTDTTRLSPTPPDPPKHFRAGSHLVDHLFLHQIEAHCNESHA